jgi:hypothetical protein
MKGGSRARSSRVCGWRNWRWVGLTSLVQADGEAVTSPSPWLSGLVRVTGAKPSSLAKNLMHKDVSMEYRA